MSVLSISRHFALLLVAATSAFGSIACSGANDQPTYTGTDMDLGATAENHDLRCESGSVQQCTIFLGRHGDLSNCIHGLDVCSDGAWTGCVDEATLSENPELYADLLGE